MQDETYTDGMLAGTNLYYRQFQESTDTAGPLVTDFTLPSGQRLRNNGQVNQPLQYIVVDLDEEMMQGTGLYSVTNTRNWALLKDGVNVQGGINSIQFGMNKAADLSGLLPLSHVGTNKWEAVIKLDGNGLSSGVTPLSDGHYQIVALPSMEDKVGNRLGKTGFNPTGITVTRTFDVLIPHNQETRVNADPAGGQTTFSAHSPLVGSSQTVASDPNGDYVVVWTSDKAGAEGVYAKMYQVTWTDTAAGRQSSIAEVPVVNPDTGVPWPNNEIRVTGDPTASDPAVARDADGDFVVTWSQVTTEQLPDGTLETSWNVFANRYHSDGTPLGNAPGQIDPFRVNTEVRDIQRSPAVAMDAEGDFVVTWQSFNQDLSGYGVYAQRYSPSGSPIGGTDEVQVVNFKNNPRGNFALAWDANHDGMIAPNEQTADIAFAGSSFAAVQAIQAALDGIGASTVVQAVSSAEIVVRFTGKDGSQDQPQMTVIRKSLTGDPGADVFVTTRVEGVSGEFRVNDTTRGDQMGPSIAMDAQGAFVVSWTGYGQDPDGPGPIPPDAPYEGNVFVKKFVSNTALRGAVYSAAGSTFSNPVFPNAQGKWFVVTKDDPGLHVVGPGDGVVRIDVTSPMGAWMGSGSLLTTGLHILTAAHVVTDPLGNPMPPSSITVTFDTPTGDVTIGASQIFVNPNYIPVPLQGGDVAVIQLASPAPPAAQRYDIYRKSDELTRVGTRFGYGLSGTGNTGSILPVGVERQGQNRYDAMGTTLGVAGDLLAYDFDNGLAANDSFGVLFGIRDTGLGNNEVSGAPGDSGGPVFINGLIAAECTGGLQFPGNPADVLPGLNSSFGDFGVDTRVSVYAQWIDQVTIGGSSETVVNQFTTGTQQWSSVAMDLDGDFVVTWTSYNQDTTNGLNGVFARRFTGQVQPAGNEFQVNSYTVGDQQHSRVSMDAQGDFAIAWESYQDPAQPTDPPGVEATFGVYAQRYVRAALIGTPFIGPNGELGGEIHVSGTVEGDQRFPGVAMDHAGDFVVVWSGNGTAPGQEDAQGVFYNRYETASDQAGPIVADTLRVKRDAGGNASLWLVRNGAFVVDDVPQIVVDFDENLWTRGGITGTNSVLNPNNWDLTVNGIPAGAEIYSIHFGLNQAYADGLEATPSNKYQAVVTFDSDTTTTALEPLSTGDYVLTVRDTVWDLFRNALDGNYDGIPGSDFQRNFTIRKGVLSQPKPPGDPDPTIPDVPVPESPLGQQDSPVVASDRDGNYVIVWVAYGLFGDLATDGNIMAQRFNAAGVKQGPEFLVNSIVAGSQIQPDVAMDPYGHFVIVWSGAGQGDTNGVFGRVFDPFGVPQGPEFRANVYTNNLQDTPGVAMDDSGDFVVAWNSYNNSTFPASPDRYGVWARRFKTAFNSSAVKDQPIVGSPEAAATAQNPNPGVLVNTYTNSLQRNPDAAMDGNGNFTVVWQSDGQDGISWGVFGQRFARDGSRLAGEFPINTFTTNAQLDPHVAMDPLGDFVVVWSSFIQPGDGSGYGVYARRYTPAGTPIGAERRVNQNRTESSGRWTTDYWQYQPAVAMAGNGMYVVTWTTDGQRTDFHDKDIHARVYNADDSDFVNPKTGLAWGEFLINATLLGDQINSNVAMNGVGDFVTVWEGPDSATDLFGIFSRVVNLGVGTASSTSASIGFEGWSGGWSTAGGAIGPTSDLLIGTPGNDVVTIVLGQTPDVWSVQLNGVAHRVAARAALIGFDGRGGYDTVTLMGTGGAEKIELWPDHTIVTGNGFTFTTANTEAVNFAGAGGADQAIFHDSAGDDTFTFRPDPQPTASLTGPGFALSTATIAKVQASATGGGSDVARLYDSSRTDTFIGSPAYGVMIPSDNSFSVTASGFPAVEAYSGAGGVDTARLYDDRNGNDAFVADSAGGTLSGPAYRLQANGFRYLHATAQGGYDTATLRDSPGVDTFEAYSTYATMSGTAFYARANAFDKVDGESRQGADMARLTGTSQIDRFEARPDYGHLTGPGYDLGAKNFRYVIASGGGGSDTAVLYDSGSTSAADTYIGTTTYGVLYGAAYLNRASGFPRVEVNAAVGSADQARFYDSPGDDTFSSDPTTAVFNTATAGHTVKNFRYVYGYATAGGNDTATMTGSGGSTGASNFEGRPTYSTLSGTAGSGYYSRVAGFDTVTALSLGNPTDIARLYDSAGNDVFEAYPTYATLTGPGYSSHATGFRYVFAYASDGTDIANFHGSAGDDAFVGRPDYGMLSGAAYLNRANYFDEVHAIAVAGGSDTAKLYDSAGDDYFWARGAAAILSDGTLDNATGALVVRKTYYNTASGFNSVGAYGTTGTNNRKVVTPMDYVLAFTGTWLGDPWP
jgi:hypothetical protein